MDWFLWMPWIIWKYQREQWYIYLFPGRWSMISTRALKWCLTALSKREIKKKKTRIVIWELCCSLPSLPSLGQQQQQKIRVFSSHKVPEAEGSSSTTVGRSADMQSSTPLYPWRAGMGSVTPAGRVLGEGSVPPWGLSFILSPRTNSDRLKTEEKALPPIRGYVRAGSRSSRLSLLSFLASSFIGCLYCFLALPELSR